MFARFRREDMVTVKILLNVPLLGEAIFVLGLAGRWWDNQATSANCENDS